jgi:hypothetical protein
MEGLKKQFSDGSLASLIICHLCRGNLINSTSSDIIINIHLFNNFIIISVLAIIHVVSLLQFL